MKRPEEVSLLREKIITNNPKEAPRELLMNACMYRDYQSNTLIRLYQFDDRIEIMNAGGLYGEARPEIFPNVNAYHNPIIAKAMKIMKYVNMLNADKLTVFEVIVKDANFTDLEPTCTELRTRLHEASSETGHRDEFSDSAPF